jgi:hypothetical protein
MPHQVYLCVSFDVENTYNAAKGLKADEPEAAMAEFARVSPVVRFIVVMLSWWYWIGSCLALWMHGICMPHQVIVCIVR